MPRVTILENEKKDEKEVRANLIDLYDTINEIAKNHPEIDTSNWFLTDEEINNMKNDPKYIFI